MAYIPPSGDDANFELIIYLVPAGDAADFNLSGIESDERDSELYGKQAISSERDSEITGAGTPSERDSELTGKQTISSERESELVGKEFVPIPRNYRILVKDQAGNFIGEFDKFRNLRFGKRLNNYGAASFDIPVGDAKAGTLVSLRRYTVWIYYEKDATKTLVWSGEQAAREGNLDDAGNNWCTIHCYDWLEQFSSRYTRATRSFDQIDAGEIAWTLIDETQQQIGDHFIALGPTYPIEGTEDLPVTFLDEQSYSSQNFIYQSFLAPMTGKLNKLYVLTNEDGTAIGTREISIYTDSADAPNTEMAGSQIDVPITSSTDTDPYWLELDYSGLDVQLVEGTKYWVALRGSFDIDHDNPVYHFTGDVAEGRVEIPADSTEETALVGLNLAFRAEFIGSTDDDEANGSFGITEGTIEATVNRDRNYFNQNIMEAIINLSNVISGFDFEITNNKVFNVYVVKGEDKTEDVILEYGVNIARVRVFEDFAKPANRAIILGQSTDVTNQLIRVERNDTTLQDTYKIREGLLSEMDVSETETMNDKGDALIRKYGGPLFDIDVDLASVLEPNITQFALGDSILLIIENGIYAIRSEYRVFEWEITYNDNNVEKLSLVLGNFTYE